jgi:2,4-dienoyl-CoA reductase-like NADH-dependent reductase (Old Yellow Enzyme family)
MESEVFDPIRVGGTEFKNRIIRSATHEGLADEGGAPTRAHAALYAKLDSGGVGGIITGFAAVSRDGRSALHRDLYAGQGADDAAWKSLAGAPRPEGARLILQLAHCGRATSGKATGLPRVAPSPIADPMWPGPRPLALDEAGIERIIGDFVDAASRAREWGFDGVQFHAAHGFLLSQFLSPNSNRRKDRWGGSPEGRFRILGEILSRARSALPGFTLLVKMNGYDGRPDGLRIPEAAALARMAQEAGCDGIEVSCGFPADGDLTARGPRLPVEAVLRYSHMFKGMPVFLRPALGAALPLFMRSKAPEFGFNLPAARAIRSSVGIPVIAVGGLHRLDDIEGALARGDADMVSMSRPLILEPDLPSKFRDGRSKAARCIRCNFCGVIDEARSLRCYYGALPREQA